MKLLICYDIPENRIRNKVAKYLESVGHRVQYSVFMVAGDESRMQEIQHRLEHLTARSEAPTLLIAPLCQACTAKIWQYGHFKDEPALCVVA